LISDGSSIRSLGGSEWSLITSFSLPGQNTLETPVTGPAAAPPCMQSACTGPGHSSLESSELNMVDVGDSELTIAFLRRSVQTMMMQLGLALQCCRLSPRLHPMQREEDGTSPGDQLPGLTLLWTQQWKSVGHSEVQPSFLVSLPLLFEITFMGVA
jgi:hypothetical protein